MMLFVSTTTGSVVCCESPWRVVCLVNLNSRAPVTKSLYFDVKPSSLRYSMFFTMSVMSFAIVVGEYLVSIMFVAYVVAQLLAAASGWFVVSAWHLSMCVIALMLCSLVVRGSSASRQHVSHVMFCTLHLSSAVWISDSTLFDMVWAWDRSICFSSGLKAMYAYKNFQMLVDPARSVTLLLLDCSMRFTCARPSSSTYCPSGASMLCEIASAVFGMSTM